MMAAGMTWGFGDVLLVAASFILRASASICVPWQEVMQRFPCAGYAKRVYPVSFQRS